MNGNELRLYTFTNFYLSSIQQGIQSAHAAVELFVKYQIKQGWKNGEAQMLNDWALNHKTMVCLNGGDMSGVQEIMQFFDNAVGNPFPWAPFYEDNASLGGIVTSVAIVLPQMIYEIAALLRTKDDGVSVVYDRLLREARVSIRGKTPADPPTVLTFTEWEYELMQRLNSYSLAR